jgi:hypothetical protein
VLLAGAVALFALAVVPLHSFLDAQAGHAVQDAAVHAVQVRAAICGAIVLLMAIAAWNLKEPSPRQAGSGWWAPGEGRAAMILFIIGVIPRVVLLFGPPHYDEAFTVVEFVWKSPPFFLSRYLFPNNHVFQTLLVWGVHAVAGDRLWALRLPAFFAGVAVLPATYLLARRASGEWAALIATALAAAATPLIEYSAQARGYTLVTLAFLLLFLIDDDRVRAILIAIGAWTIPTMFFAAASWAVWMALTQRAWRRIAAVAIASAALAFLLYVPIFVVSGPASIVANGDVRSVTYGYDELSRELPLSFAGTWQRWNISFTLPLAIVFSGAAAIAIVRRRPAGLLLGSALLAIVPLLLLMRKVPFPRIWIFVLPLYLIAAADSLAGLPRAGIAAAAMALLLEANALRCTSRDDFIDDPSLRDVPRIAGTVRTLPAGARVLVTPPLYAAVRLYARSAAFVAYPFASDADAVRASLAAAPRRYFVATANQGGIAAYRQLGLPYALVPVARFPHAVLFELRSR